MKQKQLRQLEIAKAPLSLKVPVLKVAKNQWKLKRRDPCLTEVKEIITYLYTSKSLLKADHERKKKRRLVKEREALLKLFPMNAKSRKRGQA